ncbi:MAG: hypothetical protein V1735_00095 [Nanoarchaeota archaeon]
MLASQDDFDRYMRSLLPREPCKFMRGIAVTVCSDPRFSCPYRGDEIYTFQGEKFKECKREQMLKIKRILGEGRQLRLNSL